VNETTKTGLRTLVAAALLGILGDALLRVGPPGLNVFLWVAVLCGATALLGRGATGEGRWVLLPTLLFAAGFLWRDSSALQALDFLAVVGSLALAAHYARREGIRRAGVTDYIAGAVLSGIWAAGGVLPVVASDVNWGELRVGGRSGQVRAIVKGVLLALPLLLVFGALFMAADAAFENLVTGVIGLNLDQFFSHLVFAGFLAWVAGGYLRSGLLARQPDLTRLDPPATFTLGPLETGVILGLLNALFLLFVLVQFRYFFGGSATIHASTGLTYAEYARRGFFELVTVAALVLPTLLVGHWLQSGASERLFRWLAGTLVALLYVIMVSAVQRMLLYQQAFGLTELRLYTTVFMAWLAIVFGWFLLTALRGLREHFAFGALVSALTILAALHVLNPDAFIVRTNLARTESRTPFDGAYAASLSADAVPVLLEEGVVLSAEQRTELLTRWTSTSGSDWRTWNWGRSQARQAVRASLDR